MRHSRSHRSPHTHRFARRGPSLLRWALLAACLLAVLWLAYGCAVQHFVYSARGTLVFLPELVRH